MGQPYTMAEERTSGYVDALAELAVRFGANVQPGQIVAISSEPGKEAVARAVAEEAYRAGAQIRRLARVRPLLQAGPRAVRGVRRRLRFVPPWYGQRTLALGEYQAARIMLSGPVSPRLMEDIDPALAAKDMLPAIRGVDRGRQSANHQLVDRPLPHARLGGCWSIPTSTPRPHCAPLGRGRAHMSTRRARSPGGVAVAARAARRDRPRLDELHLDSLKYTGPAPS